MITQNKPQLMLVQEGPVSKEEIARQAAQIVENTPTTDPELIRLLEEVGDADTIAVLAKLDQLQANLTDQVVAINSLIQGS